MNQWCEERIVTAETFREHVSFDSTRLIAGVEASPQSPGPEDAEPVLRELVAYDIALSERIVENGGVLGKDFAGILSRLPESWRAGR